MTPSLEAWAPSLAAWTGPSASGSGLAAPTPEEAPLPVYEMTYRNLCSSRNLCRRLCPCLCPCLCLCLCLCHLSLCLCLCCHLYLCLLLSLCLCHPFLFLCSCRHLYRRFCRLHFCRLCPCSCSALCCVRLRFHPTEWGLWPAACLPCSRRKRKISPGQPIGFPSAFCVRRRPGRIYHASPCSL